MYGSIVTQRNEGGNYWTFGILQWQYKCYKNIKEPCDAYKDKTHCNQETLIERVSSRKSSENGICEYKRTNSWHTHKGFT